MKKVRKNIKLLTTASGILLISVFLMFLVALLIFFDTSPSAPPNAAGYAVLAAIIIHLIIFAGYIKVFRENRRTIRSKRGEYIGLGVLLIMFGLIYMNGAVAYRGDKETLDLSILMFTSTLSDFTASIITFIAYFILPSGGMNKKQH